jgi:serine-type D-Ala-D-Ala carboxypeptidase (penicillin-binding protein 5/6)
VTRYAVSMRGSVTVGAVLMIALISLYALVGETGRSVEADEGVVQDVVIEKHVPLPTLTTDTWGIFDIETGALIAGNDTEVAYPIASVTKLFTAYAAHMSGREDELVTITWSDLNTEGRAGKLSYGETATIKQLYFPLLLESSNDAGEAIRRTLGADFSTQIDDVRDVLDLNSTTIADGTGLSARNVSSVVDLARFYTYLKNEEPHLVDITKLHMYLADEEKGFVNNSPFHEQPSYTGGKHGYTDEAGKTFVGSFVLPGGQEIGVVLLGSRDLRADGDALYAYGEARTE